MEKKRSADSIGELVPDPSGTEGASVASDAAEVDSCILQDTHLSNEERAAVGTRGVEPRAFEENAETQVPSARSRYFASLQKHRLGKTKNQRERTTRQRWRSKFGSSRISRPMGQGTTVERTKGTHTDDAGQGVSSYSENRERADRATAETVPEIGEESNTGPTVPSLGYHPSQYRSAPAVFLANGDDESPRKPGAFRIRGLQGGDGEESEGESLSSEESDPQSNITVVTESFPELPAVLVAGVTQDNLELQELRERLANTIEAQAVVAVEENHEHDDSAQQVTTGSSDAPDLRPRLKWKAKQCFLFLTIALLGLAAIASVMGISLSRQGGEDQSLTVARGAPTPSPTSTATPTRTVIVSPTDSPALVPTTTPLPSAIPSHLLTIESSRARMAEECHLDINMICNVTISNLEEGTVETMSCSDAMLENLGERCYSTPFRAGFLFNGGSCEQVDNQSTLPEVSCADTEAGPPPTSTGSQSFIVVTDSPPERRGYRGHIYFRGFVTAGEFYHIERPRDEVENDKDRLLKNGIRISIFRSDNIGDRSNLLQQVQYHDRLCSRQSERGGYFGASQLSSYETRFQGQLASSLSTNVATNMSTEVRHSWPSSITMSSLTATSNLFPGSLTNLTDQVAGVVIHPGGSFTAHVPLELDVADLEQGPGGSHWGVDAIASQVDSDRLNCTGTFREYVPGRPYSVSPPLPSPPPRPPTVPSPPTERPPPPPHLRPPRQPIGQNQRPTTEFLPPRPLRPRPPLPPRPAPPSGPGSGTSLGACRTKAVITCEYGLPDGGHILGDCDSLIDPRTISCADDLPATGLAFRYLGGSGLPGTVVIEASSSREDGSEILFSAPVNVGDIFRFNGDFRGEAAITISFPGADVSSIGKENERFVVDTSCGRDSTTLTLTSTFGPLELVGFENLFGYFTSILDVHLQYFVSNLGNDSLVVESANVTSDFAPEPLEALRNEVLVNPNSRRLVYEEFNTLDFGEKFVRDDTYAFAMSTRGRRAGSYLKCFDRTVYMF